MIPVLGAPSERHYVTVVAGAGPAGIMAAIAASEAGPVLLADSSALPRDKSCGGMLHMDTQRFLEAFGEVPESMMVEPRYVNFRYHDWDRGILKPTDLRFLNIDRRSFDEWMLNLLPPEVEVAAPCQLENLTEDADGITVTLRTAGGPVAVTARTVIGADGARSRVRRLIGVGTTDTYVTLQDRVKLSAPLDDFFDCIYMRRIGDAYGYSYVVPKGDTAFVGSVFYPRTKRPHEKQDIIIETLRRNLPLAEPVDRQAAAALHLRHRTDTVCGRGSVLLAGEAGGFMSPTSGEGISYALQTGLAAGEAAGRAPGTGALPLFESSTRALRSDIHRRLKWLPIMESKAGKFVAGHVPTKLVSKITMGL